METDYIFDGSFEGLLTAIYDGYYEKNPPRQIIPKWAYQFELTKTFHEVVTNSDKFSKVSKAILDKIGREAFVKIYYAFLSEDTYAGITIFNYVKLGFKLGTRIQLYLTEPTVAKIEELNRKVGNERHRFLGLLRFHKLNSGVYYAPYSPQYNISQIIVPHFAKRLATMNFIIHDTKRKIATIYDSDTKEWYLSAFDANQYSLIAEDKYQHELWKAFFKNIAIKERKNPNLQRQFMPKMYWGYLVEKQ